MKRDWDVIRSVLVDLQGMSLAEKSQLEYSIDERDEDPVTLHVFLLYDAGFLKGIPADDMDGRGLLCPDLTWEGHELLASMESKPVWEKVKARATEEGVIMTFDVVKRLTGQVVAQIFQ